MEHLELTSFTPPGSLRTASREGRPYDGPTQLLVIVWKVKVCLDNYLIPAGTAVITRTTLRLLYILPLSTIPNPTYVQCITS